MMGLSRLQAPWCISYKRAAFGTAAIAPRRAHGGRRAPEVSANASSNDPFAAVKQMAKKVQGALPIVGLLSRLASPEGGFDDLAYPEFCRQWFEKSTPEAGMALKEMEKKYGKIATSRYVLLVLWMTKMGAGIVPAKDVLSAARRLRITQDIEVEIDRFLGARALVLKKYDMISRPEGKPADKAGMAVDALCTLCLGLKDGQEVPEEDVKHLSALVTGALPEVDAATLAASIQQRGQRAAAYT